MDNFTAGVGIGAGVGVGDGVGGGLGIVNSRSYVLSTGNAGGHQGFPICLQVERVIYSGKRRVPDLFTG